MANPIHPRRKAPRIVLFAAILWSVVCHSAMGQASSIEETRIRAAMVFNLTRYVDWPAWKFPDASAPIILCFLANDPVGDGTDSLIRDRQSRDKPSPDRPVVVRRVASAASTENCHILYASGTGKKKIMDSLPALSKSAVLTISDNPTADSIIALPLVDNRVQILVDLRAAQQSSLTLSSKLLRIATVTK